MISAAGLDSSQAKSVQIEGLHFLNLLVVDDDPSVRKGLRDVANCFGFVTFGADSAEEAYRVLGSHVIDVLLLDLKLPGVHGLEALRQIKQRWPDSVIIVVTAYGSVESAVHAMKNGAYDFVTKPFTVDDLKVVLQRVVGLLKLKTENRVLREKMNSARGFGHMIGHAPEMERLYRMVAKASLSTHPVLIFGNAGSGKEMVARSIHSSGLSRDKPFVPIDCGSLLPSFLETELFGYVKGAFAGAHQPRQGLISIAEGGTLFLDEIEKLPIDLQSKLLRVIQGKEVRQIGSAKSSTANVRILAATSFDLEQLVSQGAFRRDLYFRLNVLSLRIPSLAERRQDIPLLAAHFLERISRSRGQEQTLSNNALKIMLEYDWPGNLRELDNCLEGACTLAGGPMIHTRHLPANMRYPPVLPERKNSTSIVPMTELERQTILSTIAQLNGDKLMAARLLGIGKTTLYRKLKEYAGQDISDQQAPTFL